MLLPGITEFLESLDDNFPVTTENLDELIALIQSSTGLNKESSEIILRLFFQEIRTQVLKGNSVTIKGFGKFYITSPKTNNNKKKIYPTFKPSKELITNLNE